MQLDSMGCSDTPRFTEVHREFLRIDIVDPSLESRAPCPIKDRSQMNAIALQGLTDEPNKRRQCQTACYRYGRWDITCPAATPQPPQGGSDGVKGAAAVRQHPIPIGGAHPFVRD